MNKEIHSVSEIREEMERIYDEWHYEIGSKNLLAIGFANRGTVMLEKEISREEFYCKTSEDYSQLLDSLKEYRRLEGVLEEMHILEKKGQSVPKPSVEDALAFLQKLEGAYEFERQVVKRIWRAYQNMKEYVTLHNSGMERMAEQLRRDAMGGKLGEETGRILEELDSYLQDNQLEVAYLPKMMKGYLMSKWEGRG